MAKNDFEVRIFFSGYIDQKCLYRKIICVRSGLFSQSRSHIFIYIYYYLFLNSVVVS